MTVAYIERIFPLSVSLIWSVALVWGAIWHRSTHATDWFTSYQRAAWPTELAVLTAIVAQVAAWRDWKWPIRVFLQVAWIALVIFAGR